MVKLRKGLPGAPSPLAVAARRSAAPAVGGRRAYMLNFFVFFAQGCVLKTKQYNLCVENKTIQALEHLAGSQPPIH